MANIYKNRFEFEHFGLVYINDPNENISTRFKNREYVANDNFPVDFVGKGEKYFAGLEKEYISTFSTMDDDMLCYLYNNRLSEQGSIFEDENLQEAIVAFQKFSFDQKVKILARGLVNERREEFQSGNSGEAMKRNKKIRNNFYVIVEKNTFLTPGFAEKLKKALAREFKNGKNIQVCLEGDMSAEKSSSRAEYLYSAEEVAMLDDFNNFLLSNKQKELRLSEVNLISDEQNIQDAWKFSHVKTANEGIDQIVSTIKDLSPFEAVICAHLFVSQFAYKLNKKADDKQCSFVGPLSGADKGFVCSGYATLMMAIFQKLKNPNIKCTCLAIAGNSKKTKKPVLCHALNLIKIKD